MTTSHPSAQPVGTVPAGEPTAGGGDPFSPTLQRIAAASGLLFIVLVILSIVFGEAEAPEFAAPAPEWETFARENGDKLKVGLLLSLFAAFELLWFSGVVRSALGAAETAARGFTRLSHVAFAGGIVLTLGIVLSSSIRAAAANEPADAGGVVIRAMTHVADAMGALFPLGFATLLIPASLLILGTRAFPRWLGFVGLGGGIGFLILFFYALVLEEQDSVLDPLWPVSLLSSFVWIAGMSVELLRRVGRDAAGRPAAR